MTGKFIAPFPLNHKPQDCSEDGSDVVESVKGDELREFTFNPDKPSTSQCKRPKISIQFMDSIKSLPSSSDQSESYQDSYLGQFSSSNLKH